MGRRIISLAITLLISFHTSAQDDARLKVADASFNNADFYRAIPLYEDIVKHNPKNVKGWYKLGESLYHVRNHTAAAGAYGKLLKLTETDKALKNKYYSAFYHYGNSLMALQKYDEARKIYLQFLRLRPGGRDFRLMKRMVNAKTRSCKEAKDILKTAYLREYTVERLPDEINQKYSDFGPVWLDKYTLLFTSLRADSLIETADTDKFPPVNNLHMAKQSNGQWEDAVPASEFNHDFLHTANGSLSADGKSFAFSICKENEAHEIRCAIYMSKMVKGEWQRPVKLKNHINKPGSTSTQPSFGTFVRRGHATEVLYFVSDREKGRGGMDIWYSAKDKKGNWRKPFNCGSTINTPGNEITPFYDNTSSTLYFSSDLHKGLGGYDVFSTYGGLRSWRAVSNMGPSINTGFDDTYFSWRVADASGTLVSNREGSISVFGKNCCDDIFYLEKQPVINLPGVVINTDSVRLPDVTIAVKLKKAAADKDSVYWVTSSNEQGAFSLPYQSELNFSLMAAKSGFETAELDIRDSLGNYPDTVVVVLNRNELEMAKADKIEYEEQEALSEKSLEGNIVEGKVLVMEHLYFEFDKAEIQQEAHQDLDLLEAYLKKHPRVRIEIAGHTDSMGDDEHNHDLSQRRADAIRDYLIERGIYKRRLTAVGYGEEKPIAPNENPDGSDNPEGRRKNRRTEVIIHTN